ncbi:Prolyl endopeptidase [Aphelenchoides besseyi]|nr:Prolyl endopeptidase [Aphelenchoides besseyi]
MDIGVQKLMILYYLVWAHEYGDPSEPGHFEFLRKYSPMHKIRIQKGKQWPAILSLHILANPPVIRSNCGQNQEQKSKSQNYRVTFWSEMIPIVVLILFNPTPILASQATIAEVVSSLLLMTGDHDDRVSPWQTYKYIAQLYHVLSTKGAKIQKRPILARIEADVGHGAGTPLSKSINERVGMYAFLGRVLKLEWKD